MRLRTILFATLGVLAVGLPAAHAAIIINNFSSGVTQTNSPGAAGVYGTWYDATHQTFGTPSASTLNSSAAMRIDDGGFENGVYAIYQGVVPANGIYTVSADIFVNDTATSGMSAYQIGAIVNGQHRPDGSPSYLAAVTGPGTGVGTYTGLTAGSLDAPATQTVVTNQFSASAGDDLLIAFATDVTSGGYNLNSGAWNSAFVLVDNIMLNVIPEPVSLGLLGIGIASLVVMPRRRR